MSKRLLSIILFLSLSLFLVMPVYAAEPPAFEKTTNVFPGDLDYRNSLIDWNGYNLDFAIIKDMAGGLDPATFGLLVYINGVLDFTRSTWTKLNNDPQDFQYYLNLSTSELTKIKTILFDRDATSTITNRTTLQFVTYNQQTTQGFTVYFRLSFKSLLNINFNGFYISDRLNQSAPGVISYFQKGIWLRDKEGNTIINSIVDNETTQPIGATAQQYAYYQFNQKFTNVKELDVIYQYSANNYNPTPEIYYFISEIGLFADAQVILPDLDVDTDFQIYVPTICGAFDLGCVSRNLIGEFSNNIYKRLGAENIASGIMNIYDTLFYPVYIVDAAAWQNGIISIYAIIGIGVLYLIVKRVLS